MYAAFRAKRQTRGGLAKSKGYNVYIFSFIEGTDSWQVKILARQTRNLFGKHFVHFVILFLQVCHGLNASL